MFYQEDILQHFEREMSAKDLQIQALLSDIQTQRTAAADAVALSQREISKAKVECENVLAVQSAKLQELEDRLQSSDSLRQKISSLEQQLHESEVVLQEERLFCRDELVRIASDHSAKVSQLQHSLHEKSSGLDSALEARAQARAQQIISDVFSQTKNVMAEVAFLQQQVR